MIKENKPYSFKGGTQRERKGSLAKDRGGKLTLKTVRSIMVKK